MEKIQPISEYELRANGVQSLSDRPNQRSYYGEGGLTAKQLKAHFDKLATMINGKVTAIIEALQSANAADYIRVVYGDSEGEKSLGDLIDDLQSGALALVMKAKESALDENFSSLQTVLYSLYGRITAIADIISASSDANTIAKRDSSGRIAISVDGSSQFAAGYDQLALVDSTLRSLINNIGTEIPDVSSFITNAVTDLVYYYKKSELYTKAEVDAKTSALSAAITAIPRFSILVVDELPEEDISETTIYLLRASETEGDECDEYIYVNEAWEKIGSRQIDLSGYATTAYVVANYVTAAQVESICNGLLADYAKTEDLADVATSGSYDDLSDAPELADVATSGSYNDLSDTPVVPTNTNQLSNGAGFITNSVNDLLNYYLKSEVYAKSETYSKQEVQDLISLIPTFAIEVVSTLPTENISIRTIYLAPREEEGENDIYDEYIYVNNTWEKIGKQDINLSGYATETYVAGQIADFLTSSQINTLVTNALTTALANYVLASSLAAVATSGAYSDLSGRPTLATVATTGNYNDLSNLPENKYVISTSSTTQDSVAIPYLTAQDVINIYAKMASGVSVAVRYGNNVIAPDKSENISTDYFVTFTLDNGYILKVQYLYDPYGGGAVTNTLTKPVTMTDVNNAISSAITSALGGDY